MPVAQRRSFIFVEAKPRAELYFRQQVAETQVRRRIIGRVAAEDQYCRNFASANGGGKFPNRLPLIDRRFFNRLREINCLVEISEGLIDRMYQRVHGRWLMIACDDQGRACILLAFPSECRKPSR